MQMNRTLLSRSQVVLTLPFGIVFQCISHLSCRNTLPVTFLVRPFRTQWDVNFNMLINWKEIRGPENFSHKHLSNHKLEQSELAEAVTLGPNLGQHTDCLDQGVSWYSSVLPRKCRNRTLNGATTASPSLLRNSAFTNSPTTWLCIIWVTHYILNKQ
jgi:hypothetical protein